MKDTHSTSKVVTAIVPGVKTAAADGVAIDLNGFDSALFTVNTGAVVSAGDFTVKLQESDASASGYTDVAAADLIGSVPTTLAASSAYRLGYRGSKRKRYVRLQTTTAGGTSIALGAVAVLGHPAMAPVT